MEQHTDRAQIIKVCAVNEAARTPSSATSIPYIPSKLPKSRNLSKSHTPHDDLDSSCSLSVRSTCSFDNIPDANPSKQATLRRSEDVKFIQLDPPVANLRKTQTQSPTTFEGVWASKSSSARAKQRKAQDSTQIKSVNPIQPEMAPYNEVMSSDTLHTDVPPLDLGFTDLGLNSTAQTDVTYTVFPVPGQPSPISMRGSPIKGLCLKPIASRPSSGKPSGRTSTGNDAPDQPNSVPAPVCGNEARPSSPQKVLLRSTPSAAVCPYALVVQDNCKNRANSPSCIPNHLSAPSLIVNSNMQPQNIEINFEVETGYTFNAFYNPNSDASISQSPNNTISPERRPFSSKQGALSPGKKTSNKLFRSASDRTASQIKQERTDLTRSPKRGSFMNIIKKAKGSKKGPGPVRSTPSSPSISQRSFSSRGSDSRYSTASSKSPAPSNTRHPSDEQNLIRIWADQIDGGVEGYKGFLISPDTSAKELLTTVHSKLSLPGTDKDFFLCAKFFESSIPDRPLIDTDRPLFLHHEWDTCQSYRFEVRQKPKAIMMIFGDEPLQFSRSSPFGRGAVEVSEDASTSRIISELVNKYKLDPCQRYHLIERRPNFDRILKSSDCPVLLQRRWVPFEEVKFVIGVSPSTPDLFGQLSVPSQFSPKESSSGVQSSLSMNSFTNIANQDSSPTHQDRTDVQRVATDLDTISMGSIEIQRVLDLMSPDTEDDMSDGMGNQEVEERQLKICSGFDEMQNCWMEIKSEPDLRDKISPKPPTEDLSSLEESLYKDLLPSLSPRPTESTSFIQSEFLDSSRSPLEQSNIISDTTIPRTNQQQSAETRFFPDSPNRVEMNPLSSESCRVSFGTSNDSDNEPELLITAKSMIEDFSFYSDSGVNVSEGSSYRPADHDPMDTDVPVFQISSPTATESLQDDATSCPSTPRKVSVATSILHEMSWDGFDLDRTNFATNDEYEVYLNHISAQAQLKVQSGADITGDLGCLSETDTVQLPADQCLDGFLEDVILEEQTHYETSDKESLYDSTDGSLHTQQNDSEDGLPLSESLSLLAETKLLYNALEYKTNMLEEKYFSPEKMKSALKDPLGSMVTGTSTLSNLSPENDALGDPISNSDEQLEQNLQSKSSPTESQSKSSKSNKRRRSSQTSDSVPQSNDQSLDNLNETLKADVLPNQLLEAFEMNKIQDVTSLCVNPIKEMVAENLLNLNSNIPVLKKFHSDSHVSEISAESETTESSRNSISTDSTAFLRESVERLQLEIEEIVDSCDESFSTSLDTDRHNFTDSTYENAASNSPLNTTNLSEKDPSLQSSGSNPIILPECPLYSEPTGNELEGAFDVFSSVNREERVTVGVDVTYHSDLSDPEDIHYVEWDISDEPSNGEGPLVNTDDIPVTNSTVNLSGANDDLCNVTIEPNIEHVKKSIEISLNLNLHVDSCTDLLYVFDVEPSGPINEAKSNDCFNNTIQNNESVLHSLEDSNINMPLMNCSVDSPGSFYTPDSMDSSPSNSCQSSIVDDLLNLYSKASDELQEHFKSHFVPPNIINHTSPEPFELNVDLNETTGSDDSCSSSSDKNSDLQPSWPSTTSRDDNITFFDTCGTIGPESYQSEADGSKTVSDIKQNYGCKISPPEPKPDVSYGAAYEDMESSDSSESEASDTDALSGKHRKLCRRLKKLGGCFQTDRHGHIINLECDEESGKPIYEIKLPCISEESDDAASIQINRPLPHADLKRQYKNLLAEIEETKPKLRQLEVLQSELTSMQKAYHDLKEQALRMSIEQDAQKSQIEDEIQKLKISNQDLMKKNKGNKAEAVVSTIMELEKLYSNRIAALEIALQQKDGMVKDLEEQNKNMMTQLNVTRRQSVQLETANQLLHKRNEVLAVEKQDGEINPALYFDSDDERLALLAKQCDALQQTVSSLEGTLMLRVKELNETYEDLDTIRSDLRVAEVARIEADAQLDVNKREVSRLQTVNEGFAEEIKHNIAENGKLEQDNRHLNESIESLQLEYDDNKARVARLENALLAQEKGLEAIKNSEKSAKGELTNIEKELELTNQKLRKKDDECRKFKKEVDKAKKGSSMYNLCNVLKPGETLELVSVDLPSITSQIPRGISLNEGPHGVLISKVEANSSAGQTHRIICGDRVVEINLNDVSNALFDVVRKEVESARAMQLVVARVAPDVRVESKLRADALKDQIKALVIDLDKTTKHCQELQTEAADLKDELAGVKARQKSEMSSRDNMKMAEELQNLKALLVQKDQYMKTLETTVKSKNELLVTLEMDSHRSTRSTPNSSVHQASFSPGLTSSMRDVRSPTSSKSKEDTNSENINR